MKMSGNAPFLTNDAGTRYVGIKHPDGTESVLVFVGEGAPGPAGPPVETDAVQWAVKEADTDIALVTTPTTMVVGSIFRIDNEYLFVTDVSNLDNPRVSRGQYGSATAGHAAGTAVSIWPPA